MIYALVKDGAVLRYEDLDGDAPALSANKGKWLPVIDNAKPPYDSLTGVLVKNVVINPVRVVWNYVSMNKPVESLKSQQLKALAAEGLRRANLVDPYITNVYDISTTNELWLSTGGIATAKLNAILNVFNKTVAAAAVINGLNTNSKLIAYDVLTDPNWT